MIKRILTCTDGSEYGTGACRYGIELAERLQATLTGLHVLDSRMLEGPLMANISGWFGAQPFGDSLNTFRDLMEAKGKGVADAFEALCREKNLDADMIVKWGHPARIILEEENRYELCVLGQNGEHDEQTGDLTGSTVDRVVRHCDQPCLITPAEHRPIRKMMAAYDGSGHAGKALHVAIELAGVLSIPLVIITVVENDENDLAMNRAEDAMRLARAHECPAAQLIVEGENHQVILDKAEDTGCDLIVAGAHGHSRIRELVLGSTATYLMNNMTMPLLLAR